MGFGSTHSILAQSLLLLPGFPVSSIEPGQRRALSANGRHFQVDSGLFVLRVGEVCLLDYVCFDHEP